MPRARSKNDRQTHRFSCRATGFSSRSAGSPAISAVWPSGVAQHGEVLFGPNFAARHAFVDNVDSDIGYCDRLRVELDISAVTAACMVTRRHDYLEVEGMDEVRFSVNFNDVDNYLKLRADKPTYPGHVRFTPEIRL